MRGSRHPPAPTKKTSVENTLVFCFIRYLKFHPQGWIRTTAEPTAACGGNREARLGQRSAFSKSCQEAAEKAASATRKARRTAQCNSDDRCQRQKQGGAVGAAASRMRVPPKARCSRWEPRPGLLILRGPRNPPAPTKKSSIRTGYWIFCFAETFFRAGRVDSNSSGADRRLRRKQGGEAGAALRFFKALPRGCRKSGKRNS